MEDYSNWNSNLDYFKIYDKIQLNGSERYNNMLNWHFEQLKNKERIFETGAGTGNLTKRLIENGNYVDAIDINPYALELLKRKCDYRNENLNIYNMDVQNIDFNKIKENYYDASSSMIVHPFPDNNLKYIQNCYKTLKEGGKHIITGWDSREGIYEEIIEKLGKDCIDKGIIRGDEKEWLHIKESGVYMAEEIVNKKINLDKIVSFLESSDFKNIKVHDSFYNGFSYTIECFK